MAKKRTPSEFDRELAELTPQHRWQLWIRRIDAVLFASATPVPRADLERVIGQSARLELVLDDLRAELKDRAYEVAEVDGGFVLRTRPAFADAILVAADVGDQGPELSEFDTAVLAAIAYHQPITRDGLKEIFGKEISRNLTGRLYEQNLIATGPRSPMRGAPYTFVTTEHFLMVFGLQSLRDLPDREGLEDAGLLSSDAAVMHR